MAVYVSLMTKEKELLSVAGTKMEPHPYLLGKVLIHHPFYLDDGKMLPLFFQGVYLHAKTLTVAVEDIELVIDGNPISLDKLAAEREKADGKQPA